MRGMVVTRRGCMDRDIGRFIGSQPNCYCNSSCFNIVLSMGLLKIASSKQLCVESDLMIENVKMLVIFKFSALARLCRH